MTENFYLVSKVIVKHTAQKLPYCYHLTQTQSFPLVRTHNLSVASGEIRRPSCGHAQLLLSPRKRGVDKALVKQVTDVIG